MPNNNSQISCSTGFDHGDFAIAFAPRPYLIAATTEDFFPIEGVRKTFAEVQRIYNRFGAEDKIGLFVGPEGTACVPIRVRQCTHG